MQTVFVAALLAVNAIIGVLFAYAVRGRAAPWHWPPSWLRVVAGWLGGKGAWLAYLALMWALGWISYTEEAPEWARWAYLAVLGHFTGWHVAACLYWITGRSTLHDTPAEDPPDPWALLAEVTADLESARHEVAAYRARFGPMHPYEPLPPDNGDRFPMGHEGRDE